jgi:hypothetical protein
VPSLPTSTRTSSVSELGLAALTASRRDCRQGQWQEVEAGVFGQHVQKGCAKG